MMNLRSAISKIETKGMLLTYPIDNRRDPPSLWYEFFPRTKMRWEWDSGGDNRVADLWHLKTQLSCSGKVVYSKWYRGRATFFSKSAFASMLAPILPIARAGLNREAQEMLELLRENSPLSTKELKRLAGLTGKFNESTYTRALKQLFSRFLIVGFGEVEDGAFPSLAMGATELLFEDVWVEAARLSAESADQRMKKLLPADSAFLKDYLKLSKTLSPFKPVSPACL